MNWAERVFSEATCPPPTEKTDAQKAEEQMSPGMGGSYDQELREKAAQQEPPPPPEYMGVEGEYDMQGLVKRVAVAFDDDPIAHSIHTLRITQEGSTIVFTGSAPSQEILDRLYAIARKVDGTKAIETRQVTIES